MQTNDERKRPVLFDSHAHYYDEQFHTDFDKRFVLESIAMAGIKRVLIPGTNVETSKQAIDFAESFDHVFAAVGIHPHDCADAPEDALSVIEELAKHEKVKAIGEIGLDYYYNYSPKAMQIEWLYKQLELAAKLDLPVIIHDRNAHGDVMTALNTYDARGVLHCFSGSAEMVKELVKKGWYISFSGSVTFKGASNLAQAVKAVPLDRLLCETDAPYLAPLPFRGQRNDSRLMIKTVEKLAEIRDATVDEIAQATYENACKVFDIEP